MTDEPGGSAFDEQALDELLGAYALDAVSDEERRAVEEYLLVNPRARAEVEEHREVASMLAWSGTAAPEGLWDRIAASLEEPAPAPTGELATVLGMDGARTARRASAEARRRRPTWVIAGSWVATAAAAAVVAVVVVNALDEEQAPLDAAIEEARADDGAKVVRLESADGKPGGEVVIDTSGHGFLIADGLPQLPDDRTWQLWGMVDGEAISLGILGPKPAIELFTVDGPLTQVVLTNEVAGGVITDGNPQGAYGGTVN